MLSPQGAPLVRSRTERLSQQRSRARVSSSPPYFSSSSLCPIDVVCHRGTINPKLSATLVCRHPPKLFRIPASVVCTSKSQ